MPPVRPLGLILSITAVFSMLGGHWAVLQGFAWTTMAIEYSQQHGLEAGLGKTFNGQNPCSLCELVQDGRQQEKERTPAILTERKVDLMTPLKTGADFVRHHPSAMDYPAYCGRGMVWHVGPDTPPPRG